MWFNKTFEYIEFDNWFVTGDTHGQYHRFYTLKANENNAVICLGDVGANYSLNENDTARKQYLSSFSAIFYCVRGNHEARPQDVPGMELAYDMSVNGQVYYEPAFPNIRYFLDWGEYNIEGLSCLIIGGAYSVDKYYRLAIGHQWFANEQLSEEERAECFNSIYKKYYDVVLTHTCPYSWRPVDLFLGGIDQSTVDTSTEEWLELVKDNIGWGVWCFGHYHADRIEQPFVEMYYREFESLFDMVERWQDYQAGADIEGTREISPLYVGER